MKIKNLKVNKKLASLITAGALVVTLCGCTPKEKNETGKEVYESETDLSNISSVVISDGTIISIDSIILVDSQNNEITNLEVVENGVIKTIENPVLAKLDSKIEEVIYNNQILPIASFKLIDKETKKEINSSEYVISGNELIKLNIVSSNTTITLEDSYKLIQNYESTLSLKGINYNHNEVVRTYILLNIDALSKNEEVLNTLLDECQSYSVTDLYGEVTEYNEDGKVSYQANTDKIGYGELSNNIITNNYQLFYNSGLAYKDIVEFGSLIVDEEQKNIYTKTKEELDKMSTMLDTYELDAAVVKLTNQIKNREGIYANMTVGTEYALSPLFAEFRGMVFMVCHEDDRALTDESAEAIGYLAPYSEEEYVCSFNSNMFYEAKDVFEDDNNAKTLGK